MIVVLQRVYRASVSVNSRKIGEIGKGILALVAVERDDETDEVKWCAKKTASIRIFPDETGKMNLSVVDVGGEVLAVSQFTLVGDLKKGSRPSFSKAAEPGKAQELFDLYVEELKSEVKGVETGSFGAMMDVSLTNDGPVTLILKKRRKIDNAGK